MRNTGWQRAVWRKQVAWCWAVLCVVMVACDASEQRPDAGGSADAAHDTGQIAPDATTGTDARVTDAATTPDATNPIDAAEADAAADAAIVPGDDGVIGWAAVQGDQVLTTTGGLGGQEVTPTTVQELLDYAVSDDALVIRIDRAFDVPRLQVASNKTLLGVNDQAQINGGIRIRGSADEPVTNVIVQRLRVNGAPSTTDGDAVQVYYAHHVWIDHCEIWNAPDGNLDIVHASNWVTVSWTKFRYTADAPDADHRFCNLIGHTDDNDEDVDRLKVTFHHNWWSDGVIERMPRVRHGQVHLFNNLFSASGNNYCIGAGFQSQLLIEHNVFDGVNNPHFFYDDEPTAQIVQRDNLYVNATGDRDEGQGTAFTPPYDYTAEATAGLTARIEANAGP